MAKRRSSNLPFFFGDPLCGCTGGEGAAIDCARTIDCGQGEDPGVIAEPITAVSSIHRGPTPASLYEPDPADPIDVELSWHLMSTDHCSLSKLIVERLTQGEYSVDGRHVSIHWGTFGPGPCKTTELLVSEETEDGDWDSLETPLPVYLRQALDVMASLRGHCTEAPTVARVPPDERLSFFPLLPVPLDDDPDSNRLTCMKRACEEARLREQAVEVSERIQRGLPPNDEFKCDHALAVEALPKTSRQCSSTQIVPHSRTGCRFPVAPLKKALLCSLGGNIPAYESRTPQGATPVMSATLTTTAIRKV